MMSRPSRIVMHKVSKEALIWAAIFAVALIVFGLLYAPTWWLRLLTRIPTGPQRSLLSISRRVSSLVRRASLVPPRLRRELAYGLLSARRQLPQTRASGSNGWSRRPISRERKNGCHV